ncbi:class I SAM-dependent methyltransferase [Actinomadura oligospora]|uniref:class I SAM-dependent methyltransferase n=1 Tax=Actinomadura oligospora TaxID=111804 RepID=UPI001FE06F15|nr:class I SAM-dependent methyltransferase [Actinomadura oligospora]
MFFADPVAAFANIARALRPGGRRAGPPRVRPGPPPAVMPALSGLLGRPDFLARIDTIA